MRIGLIWTSSLLAASMLADASAQPLPQEHLLMDVPAGFALGADLSSHGNTFRELIRKDESVGDWSEMITIQVYQGMTLTPAQFLQSVGGKITTACPGTVSKRAMVNGSTNGYAVSMLDLWCPLNPRTGKPESILMRVIGGDGRLYSVQYAWRSVPGGAQLNAAVDFLRTVSACDDQATGHTCPAAAPANN